MTTVKKMTSGSFTLMIAATMAVASQAARAEPSASLARVLGAELDRTQSALDSAETPDESPESWYFRRFLLRVRAKGNTQVPGFAKVEVVPEIELVFDRDLPSGWSSYKPL